MNFIEQAIKGVWVIQPERFGDKRGYFSEVFKQWEFDAHVGHVDFVQDNESFSTRGVLRGLHFQRGEWSQAKLVRVSQGCVLDVAVDLRHGSPTWGQHVAVELSADTGRQLFIPRGFAHGFVVLSEIIHTTLVCKSLKLFLACIVQGGHNFNGCVGVGNVLAALKHFFDNLCSHRCP